MNGPTSGTNPQKPIISVILTSYNEPDSIKTAIEKIAMNATSIKNSVELIVTAPDDKTIQAAEVQIALNQTAFNTTKVLRDKGIGKPAALNLGMKSASGSIIFFTDGDMYISEDSIKLMLPYFDEGSVGGVGGRPVSLEPKNKMFGYFSHLFCDAAHIKRLSAEYTPMSGYLYAIRNIKELFPIPEEVRAEDAYISAKLIELGYQIKYEPNAIAYVRFPKNFRDWITQKTRSLGGNLQNKLFPAKSPQISRNIAQDIKMALFPLKYAGNLKEFGYSLAIYPIRLFLWGKVYLNHFRRNYSKGRWDEIKSSKY